MVWWCGGGGGWVVVVVKSQGDEPLIDAGLGQSLAMFRDINATRLPPNYNVI